MRILLIAPRSEFPDVTPAWLRIPQMSLLILEALARPEHEVKIIDEEIKPVFFSEEWDLVGITVMTASASRAYSLAKAFRKGGTKVILGGIHPSVMPHEATEYADIVVVGEAEGLWERVLEDVKKNNMQRIYINSKPDINGIPFVRYSNKGGFLLPNLAPVIASRGCPYRCEFCSVPAVYGHRVRYAPVTHVVEQIRRNRAPCTVFLNDNLAASRARAIKLFSALKDLKTKFVAQFPVSFILDDEMFKSAVKAGLEGVFVGVETIDEKALANLSKSVPLESYVKAIKRCRGAGVMFHASLIFGMDEHERSIFDRTLDFIIKFKVPSVSAYVLTPYPGTALFNRMLRQKRLLHMNWAFYDHVTPVFRPAQMSVERLAEEYMRFRKNLYSLTRIWSGLLGQISTHPVAYLGLNMAFRHGTFQLKEHYRRYFEWIHNRGGQIAGLRE